MWGRRALAAVLTVAAAVGLGACAQIPTSGPVRVGNAEVEPQADIALLPQGPSPGVDAHSIVLGFLGAALAATTSPEEFQTAREFLTAEAVGTWDPDTSVRVVREVPVPEPFEEEVEDLEGRDTVEVVVRATTIATVDSTGAYTEVGDPRELGYRFTLVQVDGEWRISALDDGVLVAANLFANQYRATRLFFPDANDFTSFVPDLRWFPRRSWRTVAVQQVLAGPPEWLQGATQSLVPEGTQLESPTVQDARDGEAAAIRLSEEIGGVPVAQRNVIAEQLSATLSEGAGRTVPVDLFSGTNRLAVEDVDVDLPSTIVQPMAVIDDRLHLVEDGQVTASDRTVDLSALDPTALAISPSTEPIVVRDGTDEIVDVSGDQGPVTLITGSELAAPSVDKEEVVWTSGVTGRLRVFRAGTGEVSLSPEWLAGRRVISVAVSPEGSRVAIVSDAPSGTQVQVAGVVRDTEGYPLDLTTPVSVAAPVGNVVEARWSGLTTLALLTSDAEGTSGVWTAGVGGLAGSGGQSRQMSGLTDVVQLAAGVNDQGILVITKGGALEHEETGVWQQIADDVDLVAFPG